MNKVTKTDDTNQQAIDRMIELGTKIIDNNRPGVVFVGYIDNNGRSLGFDGMMVVKETNRVDLLRAFIEAIGVAPNDLATMAKLM